MTEQPQERKSRVRLNPTIRVTDPSKIEVIREHYGLIGPQATIDFLIHSEFKRIRKENR